MKNTTRKAKLISNIDEYVKNKKLKKHDEQRLFSKFDKQMGTVKFCNDAYDNDSGELPDDVPTD